VTALSFCHKTASIFHRVSRPHVIQTLRPRRSRVQLRSLSAGSILTLRNRIEPLASTTSVERTPRKMQSTKLTPSITAPGNVPNPRSGCQPNHLRLTIFDCRLALSKLANWQCPALSAAPRANNHNGFVILGLRPQVRVGKMNQARESGRQHGYETGSGSDRMREFYSKGKRDRFLFRLNGSIPSLPLGVLYRYRPLRGLICYW